jgi:hypothetical protein
MKIEINEYFKLVTADDGKLLSQKENGEAHIFKVIYVPLTMEDNDIKAKYTEIDENDFEISIDAEKKTYSKLFIRRACRALGIEYKLNGILNTNALFRVDWTDATEINLNDPILLQAL